MGPAQQKLLGIFGVLLIGWLMFSLAVSAGLFSFSPEGSAAIGVILLFAMAAVSLSIVLLHVSSTIRRSEDEPDERNAKEEIPGK